MKLKMTLAVLLLAPLAFTACAKKEEAPKAETAETAPAEVQISAEQQAAIDSVDQPDPEAIAIDETVVAEAAAENAAANTEATAPVDTEVAAQPEATTETTAQ